MERNLSDNTVMAYERDLKKLLQFNDQWSDPYLPSNYTVDFLKEFILHEYKKKPSPRTQARLISSLKAFGKFLMLQRERQDNPANKLSGPKLGRKLPDVLSLEEIDSIIAIIDRSTLEGERNRAIIETLYGCGLRVSELVQLKISNIFFQEDFIQVIGKGNKQRLVPLSNYTSKVLKYYLTEVRPLQPQMEEHKDTVFLNRRGNPLTRVMIFTIIKNLVSQAGIGKQVSPHTFRHSFATHLLENGANLRSIQDMLGHESITTTEIYTHINTQQLKKAVNQFHPWAMKEN